MLYLSVGFTLIVAATVVTAPSAFVNGFRNVRSVLTVNSGFSMGGYIFVMYSVATYD